jgi:toluene monooxygenase system ferredoxin subunit
MTGDLRWTPIPGADELWEGDILGVEVDGEQVLLVRPYQGPLRAFQGACPHQGALLAEGDWDPEDNVLVCPGHSWEFDLATGRGLNPVGRRLKEYPVRSDADSVWICLRRQPSASVPREEAVSP